MISTLNGEARKRGTRPTSRFQLRQNLREYTVYLNVFWLRDVFKVDREDHFWRPGFLHVIICVFLGTISQISSKKLDVTDV